jgi:hypothetical protein
MTREPEVGAGELRVYIFDQAERPRQQHGENFNRNAEGTDLPEQRGDE